MKRIISTILAVAAATPLFSEDYFVVYKDSNIFDEPNASGYVTKNRDDIDVIVSQGMVLKLMESKGGWDIVEYSPGLRGYILDTMKAPASELKLPTAGSYVVKNDPSQTVTISSDDSGWTLTAGNTGIAGVTAGNVVAFKDKDGDILYSLTVISGTPVVYSYSNDVTKFF